MDLQVRGLDDLEDRLGDAIDRIGELRAGTHVQSDAFFAPAFMRKHTEFDSFDAFCADSPWEVESADDLQDVPRARLNAYVADTTDFTDWEAMKTRAAREEIVDQLLA